MVGSRVGVSVTFTDVDVQVGPSWIGVIVAVGGAFGSSGFGGNRLNAEFGVTKIMMKYAPIHSVSKSMRMLSMSHNSSRAAGFRAGASLRSNLSIDGLRDVRPLGSRYEK